MSSGLEVLSLREDDVTKMLAANTHLGSNNLDFQMEQYVYKRRADGIHIINLRKTWEKLLLAARAIVSVEHPNEVFVLSSRPGGQRAVLKFANYTGATPIAGRFTPGAFTNQIQAAFREPRLLVVTDPLFDHQPITEASYVSIPVIGFCNTDSPLRFVDIAIPANNKSIHSIGLMWWLLAREVLRLRGLIPRETKWDVVVDLFFYREPEEAEKEEQAAKEAVALKAPGVPASVGIAGVGADAIGHDATEDWAAGDTQPWDSEASLPIGGANVTPAMIPTGTSAAFGMAGPTIPQASDDWANQPQDAWTSQSAPVQEAPQSTWGGATTTWGE